jgi:hypothetical protein
VPKLLPENQRFQRCVTTNGDDGVRIGHDCIQIDQTCGINPDAIATRSPEKINEWIYHPQRLSICQNWTFWNERRKQSRDHIYCCD